MKKNQIVPVVRELKRLLKHFYSVSPSDKCVLRTDIVDNLHLMHFVEEGLTDYQLKFFLENSVKFHTQTNIRRLVDEIKYLMNIKQGGAYDLLPLERKATEAIELFDSINKRIEIYAPFVSESQGAVISWLVDSFSMTGSFFWDKKERAMVVVNYCLNTGDEK